MFDEEFPVKGKVRNFKNKTKLRVKMRDRFGKQKKNKTVETDSIDRLNEFLDGEYEEI